MLPQNVQLKETLAVTATSKPEGVFFLQGMGLDHPRLQRNWQNSRAVLYVCTKVFCVLQKCTVRLFVLRFCAPKIVEAYQNTFTMINGIVLFFQRLVQHSV